jgi:hypothetical protein
MSITVGELKDKVRARLNKPPEKDLVLRYGDDNLTLGEDKKPLAEYRDIAGKEYLQVWARAM